MPELPAENYLNDKIPRMGLVLFLFCLALVLIGGTKIASLSLSYTKPHLTILPLVLKGVVYTEYTREIFGYCQELEFSLDHLLLPYLLLILYRFSSP